MLQAESLVYLCMYRTISCICKNNKAKNWNLVSNYKD